MREADVAIRLREPEQPDVIRRRLFTISYHLYAAPAYIKEHGQPQTLEDLDRHRLLSLSAGAPYLDNLNAHLYMERGAKNPRLPAFTVNNLPALYRAVLEGLGIATLPDYLVAHQTVRWSCLMPQTVTPELEVFFVYAEEMKNVARVQVFRDYLVDVARHCRP